MKYIKYIILLVVFLVACQDQSLIITPNDKNYYTDFNIGTNYTDYVRQGYGYGESYEMLYTQRIDYLMPLVFYFLPLQANLESQEDWQAYFEAWLDAIEKEDLTPVNKYLDGLSTAVYIKDRFENETLRDMLSLLVLKHQDTYISQFDDFKKDEWPQVEEALFKRANYLNEALTSSDIFDKWFEITGYQLNSYKIYLSYYANKDLNKVDVAKNKVMIYYDPDKDVSEMVHDISLFYGLDMVKSKRVKMTKSYLDEYHYLEEPTYLYINQITEDVVKMYDETITGQVHEYKMNLPPLVTQYKDAMSFDGYLNNALDWYLEDKKADKAYILDGHMHYQGQVYNKRQINDQVVLYYKQFYPIIVSTAKGLNILTNDFDTVPEVSADGQKILFISPFEFEMKGHLYIYDFNNQSLDKVRVSGDDFSVKLARWYSNDEILFIEGYTYGTVARGGILYKLNCRTGQVDLVLDLNDDRLQISDVYMKDGKWYYEVTVYDDQMNTYTLDVNLLDIK